MKKTASHPRRKPRRSGQVVRRPPPSAERRRERPATAGASLVTPGGAGAQLRAWLFHHRITAWDSLVNLLRDPVPGLMTCLVIGIALSLPGALYFTLDRVQVFSGQWQQATGMSLFLDRDLGPERGFALAAELAAREDIASTRYISAEEAMVEFEELSGFGDILESLDGNPLPGVIEVVPQIQDLKSESTRRLVVVLEALPEVAHASLDMRWVQRLYGIVALGQKLVGLLAVLLGAGVLLVVINTIRLTIQNRKEEILVVKLVGGTDAFVRRPFMYTGLWYGLGGGVCAWLVVSLALNWLQGPVMRFARLYDSDFALGSLPLAESLLLCLSGAFLGVGGAWLAVARYLREVKPR